MSSRDTLVVGAGAAGAETALLVARAGHRVTLLEKKRHVGGKAAKYSCKATDTCQNCSVCRALDSVDEALHHRNVELRTGSEIINVERRAGDFLVKVRENPSLLSWEKCTLCGECFDVCPRSCIERGNPRFFEGKPYIDFSRCLRKGGDDCTACLDACKAKAIDFAAPSRDEEIAVRSIVLAMGFEPFKAAEKAQFGYGKVPGVVTAADLEKEINERGAQAVTSEGEMKKIAFIQCVGSRDPHIGRDYCSRACCAYALRLARLLVHTDREMEVTVFFIDLQSFGKDFPAYLEDLAKEPRLRLVKAIPAEVTGKPDGSVQVKYEDMEKGRNVTGQFDKVVLSIGQSPCTDNQRLAEMLGINVNEDGFLASIGSPAGTGAPGIFLAGTCAEPGTIVQSLTSAAVSAAEAIAFLGGDAAHREEDIVHTEALVIGSGVAGLSACLALAWMGHSVYLVEKDETLGGVVSRHAPPSSPVFSMIEEVKRTKNIKVFTKTAVTRIEGHLGRFKILADVSGRSEGFRVGGVVVASGNRYAPSCLEYGLEPSRTVMGFQSAHTAFEKGNLPGKNIAIILDEESELSTLPTSILFDTALKMRSKDFEIYILYRNAKVADDGLEKAYRKLREAGAVFIRYKDRPRFVLDGERILVRVTDTLSAVDGFEVQAEVAVDGVIFPERILPGEGLEALAASLDLTRDGRGFLQEEKVFLQPLFSNRPGIVPAGGCRYAMEEANATGEGVAAAAELHSLLKATVLEEMGPHADLKSEKCVLCLTCYRSCPHRAIQVEYTSHLVPKAAQVDEIACRRCGVCATVCPVKAIQLPGYADIDLAGHILAV
jgi:heterodisulfide reductase subunit A-like polyferredoxin